MKEVTPGQTETPVYWYKHVFPSNIFYPLNVTITKLNTRQQIAIGKAMKEVTPGQTETHVCRSMVFLPSVTCFPIQHFYPIKLNTDK